ncbi:hypothetical protein Sjap_007839 [Stephania japonica]|uniref:Uncharacterized protein n=1 Tax=Stephania japonica TaxID=461633 RepID=A0AAP0PE20_9MAGN
MTRVEDMRVDNFGRERVGRVWSRVAERRQLRRFGSDDDDSFGAARAMTVEEMSDDDDNFALQEGLVMKKRRQLREGGSGNGDLGLCILAIDVVKEQNIEAIDMKDMGTIGEDSDFVD